MRPRDAHTRSQALFPKGYDTLREVIHLTADMLSDLTWGHHCFRVIHIKGCHIPDSKPIT